MSPVSTVPLGGLSRRPQTAVLAGNPNVGKTSVFNSLTGLRQRVGNYPGVTVDRVVGTMQTPAGDVEIVDLPGTYGLASGSPDEDIALGALFGGGGERPDVAVVVVDATNLARSLVLATNVIDAGHRVVISLNQVDLAIADGAAVDAAALSEALGVPVVPTCGRTGAGCDDLAAAVGKGGARGPRLAVRHDDSVLAAARELVPTLGGHVPGAGDPAERIAEILVSGVRAEAAAERLPTDAAAALAAARTRLESSGVDVVTGAARARYDAIDALVATVQAGSEPRRPAGAVEGARRRLDRVLTHPLWGTLVLCAVFLLVFQLVFTWSGDMIDWIDGSLASVGGWLSAQVGDGLLGSFLADGVVAGLAAFLVFVPQIALLFLCIELLEDSGYLARAAFLLDRLLGFVGLPGRSFVPMLSGFACAIPGIMATRTIPSRRDRLVTMAVVPLMSCQARLPVYALIVAALFAHRGGWFASLLVLAMYLIGVVVGAVCAKFLRSTVLKGPRSALLLELPPFRVPALGAVVRSMWRRTWSFVKGAGPIILVLSMVLWAGVTFPRESTYSEDFDAQIAALDERIDSLPEGDAAREQLDERRAELTGRKGAERLGQTYLGRAGRAIEPVIEPLGYDWKIGVAVIASFAAREVFVPTLGVIYSAGDEADESDSGLLASMRADRHPDGTPVFTPLIGISLLVFYVIALQCMSTLAVLKRETGGWRWPIGLFVAYTALAWVAAFAVTQIGRALGYA